MKKNIIPFIGMVTAAILASSCYYAGKNRQTFGHDVVIYGGTPAGITAAIQAAREGKSVACSNRFRTWAASWSMALAAPTSTTIRNFRTAPQ